MCLREEVLALFTPEDGAWRVRVFPPPSTGEANGLDDMGEYVGLRVVNYDLLDVLMMREHAGYRVRRHATGITEVTVSRANVPTLFEWISAMIRAEQARSCDEPC